jgi:hypothetical protein
VFHFSVFGVGDLAVAIVLSWRLGFILFVPSPTPLESTTKVQEWQGKNEEED